MTKQEYNRQYYLEHQEEMLANEKRRRQENLAVYLQRERTQYAKHRAQKLAHKKVYHLENRDAKLAYCRKYWAETKSKQHERQREYRIKNRDKIRLRNRRYCKTHRSKATQWSKQWRRSHPINVRAIESRRRALEAGAVTSPEASAFIIEIKSKDQVACFYCGVLMRGKDAHIDHIVPLSRGGPHLPENLCPSCKPCNSSKHNKLLSEWTNRPLYQPANTI